MASIQNYLQELVDKTANKCSSQKGSKSLVKKEYDELENVPPAPGNPNKQHSSMVKKGLCKQACKNEGKNRYCNLYPFDENIYQFSDDKSYINASWIDLKEGFKYIVTMAPMHPNSYSSDVENTCPDFWEMCWQTKAKVIVMVCSVSPGFSGCSQYFPAKQGSVYDDGVLTVKHENEKEFSDFFERQFIITKGSESHTIHHFQFKDWPNYGVPGGISAISEFVAHVHIRASELNGLCSEETYSPHLIVHCSGGIGRSGTFLTSFVAYSKVLQLIKDFNATGDVNSMFLEGISLKDMVLTMRTQRHPWMVEGLHQYLVAYETVIQLIKNQMKLLSA